MKQALKNSIPIGKKQKSTNVFNRLRLILIVGSLAIFVFFAGYIQILIKKAKLEQEYVPRIFAQYIAYTDSYLRAAERNAQLITEISSKYLQFTGSSDFKQNLWDYVSTEFMRDNPIPVIITDAYYQPQMWKNVGIPTDTLFTELSAQNRKRLDTLMHTMIQTPLTDDGEVTGYAYYSKPISFEQFIKNVDYAIIVTDRYKQPLFWRNIGISETSNYYQISTEEQQQLAHNIQIMDEIPLSNQADSLGYIYFSTPKSLSHIRYIVLLELILAMMVILFGGYGLVLLRRTEKDTLWIGLAKETAHQFGTPITSLMGWIDYLKESPPDGSNRNLTEIVSHMTADLDHLKNVASRFGKVGSMTKLEAHDLPHPCTKVFCDKTDAKYYASNLRYPIVAKLNIGSSGKGVRILKDQSEATSYINRAFSKGIRPRIGPNLRTASLLRKLRNAFSKKGLLQKRVSYYKAVYSEPQKYVIFQEFIKHSYEWRVVVIGESYFAHKKLLDGNKASGSLMKNYDNPPLELLDFVKSVCRRTGISSASLDIFETDKGWLINEIQTYFGQSDPYQMLVDGKAGRYRDLDGNWVFEPGDWASNQCYDLRMQHVIDLLQKKV